MRNLAGVQDVVTLPFIAKIAIAGWNEGSLKWRSIPREQTQLTQSTRYIETSTGLLNENCDVVPVMMFLTDHRAATIAQVVSAVKEFSLRHKRLLTESEFRSVVEATLPNRVAAAAVQTVG